MADILELIEKYIKYANFFGRNPVTKKELFEMDYDALQEKVISINSRVIDVIVIKYENLQKNHKINMHRTVKEDFNKINLYNEYIESSGTPKELLDNAIYQLYLLREFYLRMKDYIKMREKNLARENKPKNNTKSKKKLTFSNANNFRYLNESVIANRKREFYAYSGVNGPNMNKFRIHGSQKSKTRRLRPNVSLASFRLLKRRRNEEEEEKKENNSR